MAGTGKDPLPEVTAFANAATSVQLQEVDGVGAVLSARIIKARPFETCHALRSVEGVGNEIFLNILRYVDRSAP